MAGSGLTSLLWFIAIIVIVALLFLGPIVSRIFGGFDFSQFSEQFGGGARGGQRRSTSSRMAAPPAENVVLTP